MPVEVEHTPDDPCEKSDGREGEWRIVKKSDGSLEACSETREEAIMTAAIINRSESEK